MRFRFSPVDSHVPTIKRHNRQFRRKKLACRHFFALRKGLPCTGPNIWKRPMNARHTTTFPIDQNAAAPRRIAYFSMEIALEQALPTYSGGLGVLAGDTLR